MFLNSLNFGRYIKLLESSPSSKYGVYMKFNKVFDIRPARHSMWSMYLSKSAPNVPQYIHLMDLVEHTQDFFALVGKFKLLIWNVTT